MSAHVSALMKNETVSWIRSWVRSSSLNVSWTLRTPCWFLWINQSFFQAKISTSWKMWKCTLWVFLSHICHRRNNKLFSSFIDSSSLFHDAKIMCFFLGEKILTKLFFRYLSSRHFEAANWHDISIFLNNSWIWFVDFSPILACSPKPPVAFDILKKSNIAASTAAEQQPTHSAQTVIFVRREE